MRSGRLYGLTAIILSGLMMAGCGSTESISEDTDIEATDDVSSDEKGASAKDKSSEKKGTADEDTDVDDSDDSETKAFSVQDQFSNRDQDPSYDESEAAKITLSGSSISTSGSGMTVDGSIVTITEKGTYIVTGELSDGQIIIDTDDKKVQLVLDNVTITNSDSACIYVKNADKVFVTLAEGSVNTLADTGKEYTADGDTNVDGVIFSKDDIVFNGSGTLNINASYKHGIVGKDDLKITGGTFNITAEAKGIVANDSIRILDGDINVTAGDDTLHTDTEDDPEKGYVYIAGGSITLSAGDDGIHAETELVIDAGTINIVKSYEGLEGAAITINDGDISVTASDDGMNATGTGSISQWDMDFGGSPEDWGDQWNRGDDFGGEMPEGMTPPDGEMPEDMTPPDGEMPEGMTPPDGEMPEGMTPPDGEMPEDMTPPDGEMPKDMTPPGNTSGGVTETGFSEMSVASEDGIEMPQGFGGGFGGGMMMDATEDAVITINGGKIYINASGDGIDSNGYIYVYGGEIYVDGPTSDGDGALDTGIDAYIYGGTVVAAGSSGMAETFSSESEQYSILYNFSSSINAGTEVQLIDSDGNMVISYTPSKYYSSVVLSSSKIKAGTYTIKAGNSEDTIEVSSISTSTGSAGGMGGGRGGWGDDSSFGGGFSGDENGMQGDKGGFGGSFGGGRRGRGSKGQQATTEE